MIIQQSMTMKLLFLSLLMSVLLLNVSKCFGAEYIVQPGSNTIAAAISAASSGDTLVLQAGSFVGDVSIDKSLTVRAISASTNSVVEGLFEINGPGIEVTIQGLKISNSLSVVQGGAVNILQNELVVGDIDVTQYATSTGAGTLVIIGNRLNSGYIRTVNSENAYIAGNVVTNGAILVNASAWVIGNDIYSSVESSILGLDAANDIRIIGNRLNCAGSSCVSLAAGAVALVQNNIIRLRYYSFRTSSGVSFGGSSAVVANNVIIGEALSGTNANYMRGVYCGAGLLQGNIFLQLLTPTVQCNTPPTISNNICHLMLNGGECTGGDYLNEDPLLVDFQDFRPLASSPVVDAGSPEVELSDLDRSRNDIGVYGGPWRIDQFDVQRDPLNFAPYVYPMFSGSSAFSGGTLDVKAVGVAKLR